MTRIQIRDLDRDEALDATALERVRGGILPYIEQDNLIKLRTLGGTSFGLLLPAVKTGITDGTSNTKV